MEEKEFRFPNKEDKAWCPFIVHESGYIEVLGKKALTWSECEGLITQLEKKFKGEDKKYGIMEYESVPVFLGKTIVEADDEPDPVPRRKKQETVG